MQGMLVQPDALPGPADTVAGATEAGIRLPATIRIGIVLVVGGLACLPASLAWAILGIRSGLAPSVVAFLQVNLAFGLAEGVLINVGFSLILAEILRLMSQTKGWAPNGPPLLLVGAAVIAVVSLIRIALTPSVLPPFAGQDGTLYYDAASVGYPIASVLLTLGTVLSLVAIARAALLRRVNASGA